MIKDWCETGVIDIEPKPIAKPKRSLTDEQFQASIVKIQDGECIKGSTVTVYDWVRTECQLTEAQQSTFNLLNTTDNGTD
jgi:hypothetical protein